MTTPIPIDRQVELAERLLCVLVSGAAQGKDAWLAQDAVRYAFLLASEFCIAEVALRRRQP